MEKLEAALAKARQMRQQAMGTRRPVTPGEADKSRPESRADGWIDAFQEIVLDPARLERNRITALAGGREATPYDMLRSRSLRFMREKEWNRLAITSPGAACGKTTIAVNLALSLARQKDLKVMLFDLDLRRPALHRVLGQAPSVSFHEVLTDRASFQDNGRRIGDNLVVAMNAGPARMPAEILQAERTAEILDEIERRWQPDIMIFDTSPLLATDDNVGFLGNVDCALLVAAAEKTTLPNIDICEKELAQLTNVLGIVLNKCRYPDTLAGYDYEYYG